MNENDKSQSGLQTAVDFAHAARAVKRIMQAAAVSGVHGAAAATAREAFPVLLKVLVAALVVFIVMPMVIFTALPNIFFGYNSSGTDTVIQMTQQAMTLGGVYMTLGNFEGAQIDSVVTGIAAEYEKNGTTIDHIVVSSAMTDDDLLWVKVICLVPARDGRIYELRKMEQGEFIAPKNNVVDFSEIRAGFAPALPKIPAQLMGQIIAFFRAFMTENEENEALALIYWDKAEKRFFAYVPKQSACKEEVEANLHDCPYDDEERYICYADIHSHNSMDAFFSRKDDRDERSVGLYFVLGELDHFYPTLKARIFCGDSFVPIDPAEVIEGLEQPFPQEWLEQVSVRSALPKKEKKRSLREFLSEVW